MGIDVNNKVNHTKLKPRKTAGKVRFEDHMHTWLRCEFVLITSVISFYTFNVFILCVLSPRRWAHGLPKHLGSHCLCQLISIFLCASIGTTVVYIYSITARTVGQTKANSTFNFECKSFGCLFI